MNADRLESILDEARSANSPEERAAFLDVACADDFDLRQRVEALLNTHEEAGGELEKPTVPLEATSDVVPGQEIDPAEAQGANANPPTECAGTRIGVYRLLGQIGEGGMGTVWRAEQQEPVRRKVALKVIKAGMDSSQIIARFAAERQALAMMDHQNIAKVFDAGTTATGRPFFVMELVDGIPITKYCDEHRLTPRERLALFVSVCLAIQHAHQKGIIHRDIKPSNVLVAPYDGKPVVKVIDFGVAKATGQRLTDRTLHTEFGAVVGTLEYMSPEQAELTNHDIDTRSDIYSLGVLLYELLTGTTPLSRKRLKPTAFTEMLRLVREEEPPKPSTRLSNSKDSLTAISAQRHTEPAKLTKLVRGELDWIVMKALEKDRARRYATANGFARDIERYLNDEPIEAYPPSAWYRLRKFGWKNKKALSTAAAFVALLLVGVIASTWLAVEATISRNEARTAETKAQQERDNAENERAIAESFSNFLQKDLLAQASPEAQPDRDLKLRTLLDRTAGKIEGKFEKQPLVEASIRLTIGQTYEALGLFAEAEPHLECAYELRRQVKGDDNRDTLAAATSLVKLYGDQGRYGRAEPLVERTLAACMRELGPEHLDTLRAMLNLAWLCQLQGKFEEAEQRYLQTLESLQRTLGGKHRSTLRVLGNLSALYQDQGNYEKAEPLKVEVLELRRVALGEKDPDTLLAMNNLGDLYRLQGKPDDAGIILNQALEIGKGVLGDTHPITLLPMHNLAMLHLEQGRYPQAEELFRKALEAWREKVGEENRGTLITRDGLAALYRDQGKYELAAEHCSEVLKIRRRMIGDEHPDTLESMHNLAVLNDARRRSAEAEKQFLEVVAARRRVLAPEHPQLAESLSSLGRLLLKKGEFSEAEASLREGLTIQTKKQPNHWTRFEDASLLGASLLGQKKYAEAEPLLLEGYQGTKQREAQISVQRKSCLTDALEHLVQLYATWDKPDEAARWRRELEAMKKSEKKAKP